MEANSTEEIIESKFRYQFEAFSAKIYVHRLAGRKKRKRKRKRITNLVLQLLDKVQFDPQILIISISSPTL